MEKNLNIKNDHLLSGPERIDILKLLIKKSKKDPVLKNNREINNHIHTIYSFSPYSPTMAAIEAKEAGLAAAGSVDHDSIAAAQEMLEACSILGLGGCVGFELRVSFKKTADGKESLFAERKINNPDSEGSAYMTVQGIPRQEIPAALDFLKPIRQERLERTRKMAFSANAFLREALLEEIDFESDIYEKSKFAEDGSITERHLLAAAAVKYILRYGKNEKLLKAVEKDLRFKVQPKTGALLCDDENPHYLYDLLGVLKQEFLPKIFIQPDENECVPAFRVTAFADSIGAVPSYAYLGDVGESVTGDKKAEKFEDDFLEELFTELWRLDYRAVTYMPPRNTLEQLKKVRRLCREWGFMEISGVDINSSRQSFNCPEVLKDEFCHLIDTTWALIAHERLASADKKLGLFSKENPFYSMELEKRLDLYASLGKKLDLHNPDESAAGIAEDIRKGRLT